MLRATSALLHRSARFASTTAFGASSSATGSRTRAVIRALVVPIAAVGLAWGLGAFDEHSTVASEDKDAEAYKYVIVGGGTAAHFAMLAIREKETDAKILVVSSESDPPYPRPPLSKYLWFQPLSPKDASAQHRVFFYPGQAYKSPNVSLLLNTSVTGMNVDRQEITLSDGRRVRYDKVLLATGGRPKTLADMGVSVPEECRDQISTFRTRRDFERLYALSRAGKSIVVVGGGLLGSEITVALSHMRQATGSKAAVHQLFPESGVLGLYLPNYLSAYTTLSLQKTGIDVRPRTTVSRVSRTPSGRVLLELNNGTAIEADHVVTALGIRCNNEIAKAAGLEIDAANDGIIVNQELEARRNVFAAGDVCSYYDVALGRRRVEHQDHAEFSGMRAGANMTGERVPYTYQSLCWSSLGDIRFEACGIMDPSLETVSVWQTRRPGDDAGQPGAPTLMDLDPYRKGVIFYMRNQKARGMAVVGVLLWNVRDAGDRARALLQSGRVWTNRDELAAQIPL